MMKTIKFHTVLLLAMIMVFGCSKYDDTELRNDVNDLQSRVTKLEEWCKTANTEISALRGIVTALEAKDYVTGVSPITEGSETVGYTITFSKSGAVTIRNGKNGLNGVTPIIGVAKHTDGLYYWTVRTGDADATWMLNAEGKMIRATGDQGTTPQLSIGTDTDGKVYWKVNGEWLLVDGKKVQATGDKGDSIFAEDGIDLTDPNNVTFTLADGTTKITFPRTGAVKIFDSFNNFKIAAMDVATNMTLSLNIKEADYKAIKAELTSSAGLTTAIKTRSVATPWQVAITAPTFKADGTVDVQPVVSITAKDAVEDDIVLLKVSVIDSKGDEHSSTRVLFYSAKIDVESVTIDETLALAVNEEHTLTATVLPVGAVQTMTWTTSDATIATVDANGKVKGLKAGTTTIKAASTTNADKFDECTVTVNTVAVSSITLDGDKTVSIGGKVTPVATILPVNATVKTVTWGSSNTDIATINATTGEVEGKASGEVTITATVTDGSNVTGTCKVTVDATPSPVIIYDATNKTLTLPDGKTVSQINNYTANELVIGNGQNGSAAYTGTTLDLTPPIKDANGTTYTLIEISARSFMNQTSLVSVSLPTSLKAIADRTFNGCSSLRTLKFTRAAALSTFGNFVFTNSADIDLTLGAGDYATISGLTWRSYTWKSITQSN